MNTNSSSNNNNNNNSDNNDECDNAEGRLVQESRGNLSLLQSASSGISRHLLQLTGDSYRVELENAAVVSSYDAENYDKDDDRRILLLPSSGQLSSTCQHTFVLDTRHTLDDDEQGAKFAHMRSIYVHYAPQTSAARGA